MSADATTGKPSRALWAALLLPPVLWMAQEAMGWFLGGESCPAAGAAAWSARTVRIFVQVLTALSLVVVVSSLALAHRHRRAPLPAASAGAATERERRHRIAEHVIESRETRDEPLRHHPARQMQAAQSRPRRHFKIHAKGLWIGPATIVNPWHVRFQ